MTRVLAPVDGSDASVRALDSALDLAGEFDGTIHVVHVSDERTDAAETTLDRAREAVAGNTLTDTPDVELIDQNVWIDSGVGKAIVRFAEDGSYDHTW